MSFQDLDEFVDDCLPLPYKGKVYRIPDVDYDTGVWLTTQIDRGIAAARGEAVAESAKLDDAEEKVLWKRCLGPVLDELRADGVGWTKIKHFGGTALMWHTKGIGLAEKFWREAALPSSGDGGDDAPEGQARGNRASRRASSAGANAAPSPASTSTTTGGKKSPRDHLPPRGKRSSSTGA